MALTELAGATLITVQVVEGGETSLQVVEGEGSLKGTLAQIQVVMEVTPIKISATTLVVGGSQEASL